jgi:enoyl-CoA hydratase
MFQPTRRFRPLVQPFLSSYIRKPFSSSTRTPEIVTVESHGNVAVVNFDDSKMNAFSFEAIKQWNKALDVCENADGVAIFGNDKAFSAGFDLSVMGAGPSQDAMDMLRLGGELCLRMAEFQRPIVIGATGHSLALGAIMCFCADYRIVVNDNPKLKTGLTEVAIGIPVPEFALALGRQRLSPTHLTRATTLAEVFSVEDAIKAGYYDIGVNKKDHRETTLAVVTGFSEYHRPSFVQTKQILWADSISYARERLEEDIKMFQK